MKTQLILIAIIASSLTLAAVAESTDPPMATDAAPATKPAGYSIHGHLKLSANLDFQKPDLTRAVVYLGSDVVLDAMPIPATRPTIAQMNKAFDPNFLAIPRGTTVEFPNWDHFSHNVYSKSPAAPAFDLDRYPYGQSKSTEFQKSGVVQIFCNIHPNMKALVMVAPNKFFTRADKDGNFTISDIPAGHFTLVAWQERCGQQQQMIDVGPSASSEFSFTLSDDRESILANDPPVHGDTYGVERGLGVKREKLNLPVVTEVHAAPTSMPCPNCQ